VKVTTATQVPLNKYGYNTMIRHMSMVIITALPLFLGAGTWSWDWAWIYVIASLIGWGLLNIVLAKQNPGLLNERGKSRKDVSEGAKNWDKPILLVYTLLVLITPLVAGLDYRNHWSVETSPIIHIIGIGLLLFGFVPLTWAMAANKFFEPMVRINTEAGHRLMDSGPYQYVRHPGYVGVILHFIAVPIALGTWVALIPALIGTALFILRTALEDQTLQGELPGYKDFAGRTRYRLFPGIW
jgi:protein-S-isoprenylcysteine O-methyltransferase Ste14